MFTPNSIITGLPANYNGQSNQTWQVGMPIGGTGDYSNSNYGQMVSDWMNGNSNGSQPTGLSWPQGGNNGAWNNNGANGSSGWNNSGGNNSGAWNGNGANGANGGNGSGYSANSCSNNFYDTVIVPTGTSSGSTLNFYLPCALQQQLGNSNFTVSTTSSLRIQSNPSDKSLSIVLPSITSAKGFKYTVRSRGGTYNVTVTLVPEINANSQ